MWFFLALFGTFNFAITRVLQRFLLKDGKHDSVAYSIYFQLLVAFIILPFALINGFVIPNLSSLWPFLALMTVLYGFANSFSYISIRRIPISEFMIIMGTVPVWTTLTSIPLLGESTSVNKFIGIALTVIGVSYVFYTGKKLAMNKGHLYAFLASLCFGFAFTNDAFLLNSFNVLTYSVTYFLLPAIFLMVIYPKNVKLGKSLLSNKEKYKFLASGIFFAIAALSINFSYKLGGEISQITSILQLSPILAVILGIILLKERDNLLKKLIGAGIVILGVFLLRG